MKSVDMTVVIKLLELCLIYGVPAIYNILKSWNKEKITSEDIDQLELLVKSPKEYF